MNDCLPLPTDCECEACDWSPVLASAHVANGGAR